MSTLDSKVSPTATFHFSRNWDSKTGSCCRSLSVSIRGSWVDWQLTLCARRVPIPTSLTVASTSIFHRSFVTSPNHCITCRVTSLLISCSSWSAPTRSSTGAFVCGRDNETSALRSSSRTVVRCDDDIGRRFPDVLGRLAWDELEDDWVSAYR